MQTNDKLTTIAQVSCDCCQTIPNEPAAGYDCAARRTVFTPREEEVLSSIRKLGDEARETKKHIERLAAGQKDSREYREALNRFENLRRRRAELEEERIAAADERMRLLGHA